MRSWRFKYIFFAAIFFFGFKSEWGFEAHKTINRKAVYSLPPEMFGFYKKHLNFIEAHSIDPDKRRHADPDEPAKHYIDIDHFAVPGEDPFEIMPVKWSDAVEMFTEDTLKAYGILPWQVTWSTAQLTKAFEEKNVDRILQLSADLGHYVADANVPLHTTENYNGQLSGQEGIHAFWESRLVELYLDDYDLLTPKAHYIENTNKEIWGIVQHSFSNTFLVFSAQVEAGKTIPDDQKFVYTERGSTEQKIQSIVYSNAYNQNLDGMVEDQMKRAIEEVASFWYTAWVNAGQPDLDF
jgi:hypothetical protein